MPESPLANADCAQLWLAFVRNLAFNALLAMRIEHVYTSYGNSLSNRRAVARHGLTLSITREAQTGVR